MSGAFFFISVSGMSNGTISGSAHIKRTFVCFKSASCMEAKEPLLLSNHCVFLHCKVVQANTVDERTNFLVEEYSTSGRLDNITQVMSLHAQYLESFLRSQFYMLRMDGPLPLPHRHYIAIMAAARHQCSYLINMHVDEFLKTGGIAEWLNGLECTAKTEKS